MAAMSGMGGAPVFRGRATVRIALILGLIGSIAVAIGLIVEPHRATAAYLVAWSTFVTLAVGGLSVLAIGYAANARWPSVVRRLTEALAAALPVLALLFLPLLAFADEVWPWIEPSPELARELAGRGWWFSLPSFVVRSAIYLGLFLIAGELLIRWSRRRDRAPEPAVPRGVDALGRERAFASAMLPVIGLALTFASFDWLMSVQPRWWSTAFGLYVLTGALGGGLALVIVLAWRGVAQRVLPLTTNHFHALGRLLLAFVILWGYIAYFQAFLIQIANRPDEVTFYLARITDGWRFVTLVLVALRLALPFPLLLSRRLKQRPRYLGVVSILVLVGHYLDLWWLVMPVVSTTPVPSWLDLAALLAVGGLSVAAAAWRMRGTPLLPIGDPYLQSGLDYASTT